MIPAIPGKEWTQPVAPMDNPYEKFMAAQISTTPPEKLILMCYDGIIKFCNRAIEACNQKKIEETHRNILRAQAIITELQVSLRMDAGEVAQNLDRLYDFLQNHLVEANLKKDPQKLRDVIEITSTLREGWAEACVKAAQPQPLRAV